MRRIILSRLAQGATVVALVIALGFVLIRLAPGDPFAASLDQQDVPAETRDRMRALYGFDAPIPVQFVRFAMTPAPVLLTRPRPATWIAVFAGVLLWSGIEPKDTVTWVLEVAPAVIAAVVLLATRRRFPLTRLAYVLILVHCIILMVGGHYTYAEVPAGDWIIARMGMTPTGTMHRSLARLST